MSSQNFSTYFLQAPYTGRSKVSHILCMCVIGPCSVSFACIPFVLKCHRERMSGKPALLPLPTYILLGFRNRKLFIRP